VVMRHSVTRSPARRAVLSGKGIRLRLTHPHRVLVV
jgi:hypothetical protein